jgi:hypothetical protein
MTDERKALVERLRTRLFGYPAENQRLKLVVDESAAKAVRRMIRQANERVFS